VIKGLIIDPGENGKGHEEGKRKSFELLFRMNPTFDGFAFAWADGVVCRKVPFSSIVESNTVSSDRLFPLIMDGIRTNQGMMGAGSCNSNQPINKLTAGYIDSFAIIESQKRRQTGLSFFGFIVNGTTGKSNVSTLRKTYACSILGCVSAKGIATNIDQL